MSRPIQARINLSALQHNEAIARRHAGRARLWAVVKADAYGHGLLRVAQALADCADGFALIELEGAMALREIGLRQPILMLEGFYSADELPLFAEYGLTPVLHSLEQVETFIRAALPMRLPVYLKLNTGMNRLGLNETEFSVALGALKTSSQVSHITLMTHFAEADGPVEGRGIVGQLIQLDQFCERVHGARSYPLCMSNSAALLRYPELRQHPETWVRPGIMLYGSSPLSELQTAAELGLRAVMTLQSRLIAVRKLAAGERIGYGGNFMAEQDMTVGVVACGYGDGYPRHAPTGTPVLVDGQRTRTLGRVSMDKLCVDLSDLPHAAVGTPVVLWGDGLSVDEVAKAAGTISYELLCALAGRVAIEEVWESVDG